MTKFYDPDKLLNSTDRNGDKPEVLVSISNRGAGKTYGFAWYLLRRYFCFNEKFALLCRWKGELGNTADGIMKAVLKDRFPGWTVTESIQQKGTFSIIRMLYFDEESGEKDEQDVGYVLPINGSSALKNVSSTFSDVITMFFDEFQCDKYCPNETEKFVNLHFTVARGDSEGVRFVPVILASNSLSILNPYFRALDLTNKIQSNTKFYKGEGLVMERFINSDVAAKQKASAFNRAFSKSKQVRSNIDNTWLNDSWICVAKPNGWGKSQYVCTLKDNENCYGVYKYENGLWYCGRNYDPTSTQVYALSFDSEENTPIIRRCGHLGPMCEAYLRGDMRFADIEVKEVITNWL